MDNNNDTKEIIYSFFKNNIPRNMQLFFQHWLIKKENEEEKNEVLNQLWNEVESLADESTYKDLKELHKKIKYLKRKTKPFYIQLLRVVAMFVLPITIITATYLYFTDNVKNIEIVKLYVPKGETKHLILSDGTEVWVNSESYLSYPKEFRSDKRILSLTGEAYFYVTKDNKKPFIVETENMNIEVLGTKFNINAYPDLDEVKTTLKEGKVKVKINHNKKNNTFFLSPNKELSLNIKTGEITRRDVVVENQPGWSEGNMVFNDVLISDIFKHIEREYDLRVICETLKCDNKRLTVKFGSGENIDDVLQILQLMVPDLLINKQDSTIFIK